MMFILPHNCFLIITAQFYPQRTVANATFNDNNTCSRGLKTFKVKRAIIVKIFCLDSFDFESKCNDFIVSPVQKLRKKP